MHAFSFSKSSEIQCVAVSWRAKGYDARPDSKILSLDLTQCDIWWPI